MTAIINIKMTIVMTTEITINVNSYCQIVTALVNTNTKKSKSSRAWAKGREKERERERERERGREREKEQGTRCELLSKINKLTDKRQNIQKKRYEM